MILISQAAMSPPGPFKNLNEGLEMNDFVPALNRATSHPTLVLLPCAFRHAKRCAIDRATLQQANLAIDALATAGHELFFGISRLDIEKAFREKTGFDLSLREGPNTTKDKELMRLRRWDYGGERIFSQAHVKWGNRAPRCFRLHFLVDRPRRVIVICRLVHHLETYTSKAGRKAA